MGLASGVKGKFEENSKSEIRMKGMMDTMLLWLTAGYNTVSSEDKNSKTTPSLVLTSPKLTVRFEIFICFNHQSRSMPFIRTSLYKL